MAPENKLHVVMFPWLAFGHMIPYLELAKRIAQKGHCISFVSTPRNIDRLPKLPSDLVPHINFVKLPLPPTDNLPENAEATIDVPYHKVPDLKLAYDGLKEPMARFLESSTPDWIIYDFAPHWLPPIAAKLGISRAFFSIFWASSLAFLGSSLSTMMNGDDSRTEPEHFTFPPKWIPFRTSVAFRLYEVKRMFDSTQVNVSGVTDFFRLGSAISGSDVFATRSCTELDSQWLDLLGELHKKPVVPVGFLTPEVNVDKEDSTWPPIREWLDKQNQGTVVYIAFGSEVTLNQEELTELALGLERSGLPFFWVLRNRYDLVEFESDSVELPEGFEDRTKGRGVVWTSWVPQLNILGHESVGSILTHCGTSSIIEALQFGRALIMLPFIGEQGLIARVFEEMGIGIEVPRDEKDGSFTRDSIARSLRLVMVDEEGSTYKDKAKEMSKIYGDRDLHHQYIDRFVEYLQNHVQIHQNKSCKSN